MKMPMEHWFWGKLLETNTHAKRNNALNMEQLYCGKMEKVHSNEKYGDCQLMCSKFKTCAMPRAKVFKVQNMCNA
jgi:hypothetical protein